MIHTFILKENSTSATDTAPPAGPMYDYVTSVACPAPSCKNMLFVATFLTQK